MKNIFRTIILAAAIVNCQLSIVNGQTLSPKVTPTNGGYATGGGNSLSWTMGETFNTTLTVGSTILSQGEQQPEYDILTGVVATTLCASAAVNVPYTAYGYYGGTNVFTAQLSNAGGSFASPVSIGSLTSTVSGTISCIIPSGTNGAGYRIRVVSNHAAYNGKDNGSNILISTGPPTGGLTTITLPANGCVGGSSTITCSTLASAAFYSWSASAGITFGVAHTAGPFQTASPAVQINFDVLPPSGSSGWNVTVFAGNACGITGSVTGWIRATLSTPAAITGSTVACPLTSGAYSTSPVYAGVTNYVWTITGNANVNGIGATVTTPSNSITLNFLTGFTNGTLSVHAQSACGYNTPDRTIAINYVPIMPGIVSGPATVCPLGFASYSIATVAGALPGIPGYTWSCSVAGSSVVQGGTSCTVTFPAIIPSGSLVCVTANSACGPSAQRCRSIASGVPGTPPAVSGPTYGNCGGTSIGYSIVSMASATGGYNWTLPAGCTFTGSSNNNSVLINFPNNFTSGNICAQAISSTCGAGGYRCIIANGWPALPAVITGGPATACPGSFYTYQTAGSPNAASYNWTFPLGTTIVGTATGLSINVIWGSNAGNVSVSATNACGTSSARTFAVVLGCRQNQMEEATETLNAEVYPNPSQGNITVKFNCNTADKYSVKVLDMTARVIMLDIINAKEGINLHELDLSSFAKGMYMITLESKDANEVLRVTVE